MPVHAALSICQYKLHCPSEAIFEEFPRLLCNSKEQDSPVDIVINLQAGRSGFRISVGVKYFLFPKRSRPPKKAAHLTFYSVGSFPGLKRPGRDVDHLYLSSVEPYFYSPFMSLWEGEQRLSAYVQPPRYIPLTTLAPLLAQVNTCHTLTLYMFSSCKRSGHFAPPIWTIKVQHFAHTLCLCVPYDSHDK